MSVRKSVEQLEAEMNRERLRRNQRLTAKLEREQRREKPRRRLFPRFLLVLALVLAALLVLSWMVLQRTHIVVGLGFLDLPFLTQIVQN